MNINDEIKTKFIIKKNKNKKKFIINLEDINNFPLNKFNKLKLIPKLIKISNNKTLNNKNNFKKFSLEQLKFQVKILIILMRVLKMIYIIFYMILINPNL